MEASEGSRAKREPTLAGGKEQSGMLAQRVMWGGGGQLRMDLLIAAGKRPQHEVISPPELLLNDIRIPHQQQNGSQPKYDSLWEA